MVRIDFEKTGGMIPAVAQDYRTGEVLMLAYMNKEAWETTLNTGFATYFSRSRRKLWIKGETSGHRQVVKEIRIDCDDDSVLLKVEQLGGAACHTGHTSCFYRQVKADRAVEIIGEPIFNPEEVYKK